MIKAGSPAPDFDLLNDQGKNRSLKSYKSPLLLLYFYPKDDTPGCTAQACSLRDSYAALEEEGVKVVGVSPDDVPSHVKFKAKYNLPFELLADPESEVAESYGVWKQKSMFGNKYWGIKRTSFLIKKGKVVHVFDKVKTESHAQQVLEWLEKN